MNKHFGLTDRIPMIRALCDLVAGFRCRLSGILLPETRPFSFDEQIIASKLELGGADIDALRVLFVARFFICILTSVFAGIFF